MKKTAVVTGGTKDQFPAMAVLALNIADKCPDLADELVIFHDGVPIIEQEKVKSIYPTRFIEFENPFSKVSDFSDEVAKYFSPMVFCKYECWKLLDEYRTVIWTDYDVLIKKDISLLGTKNKYDSKFFTHPLLVKKFHSSFFWDEECVSDLSEFDILGMGISSGLFVLFDSLVNYREMYDDFIRLTIRYGKHLYLPEEAAISVVFQQRGVINECLDEEYCIIPKKMEEFGDGIKILHAAGQPKFWNGLVNKEWQSYYEIWIKKYKGQRFPSQYSFRKIIKKLFKSILPYGLLVLFRQIRQHK